MTAQGAEFQAVAQVLSTYFDGLYLSDTGLLARVFHPQAIYACATDGTMLYRTMEEYFPIVAARPSPQSQGQGRADRILSIDFAGPVTARALVNCAMGERFFTDCLTLVKLNGRWQIIAKVFHYDERGGA